MYGTLTDANDYLSARGLGPITEGQLTVASDYLDLLYGSRFVGVPTGAGVWPRSGAVDCMGREIEGTPDAMMQAAALLAVSGIAEGAGMSNVPAGAVSVREGQLAVAFGAGGAPGGVDALPTLPVVDALMRCLLRPVAAIEVV